MMVRAPVRSINQTRRGAKIAPTANITVMPPNDLARQAERVLDMAAEHRGHQEGGAPTYDLREAEADRRPGGGREDHAARDLSG